MKSITVSINPNAQFPVALKYSVGSKDLKLVKRRLKGNKEDLKVHKIENFFDSDFGICVISLLVMHK
jgi:hypothetical protein